MELKHTISNGEIVLIIKVNPMEYFVLEKGKNWAQRQILYIIFSKRCYDCLKNKVLHNFDIKNPNRMNQSFPFRQKHNLWKTSF